MDPRQSAALAGEERVIVPATSPWCTCSRCAGAYNQFHCQPAASARAAAAGVALSDYDGVAETFCRDLDAFNTIMTSAEVADEGISDQREFIDASRSTAALYEILRA
jgi:hypothetical protein